MGTQEACAGEKKVSSAPDAADFEPVRVLEVDIQGALPAVPAFDERTEQTYRRAISLVRLHSQTMGVVEMELGEAGLSADEYSHQIWRALGPQIVEHLRQDGLPAVDGLGAAGLPSLSRPKCIQERDKVLAEAPFVSIIVATRDRADSLAVSLNSLLALDYPNYEIVVVDNAPATSATAELVRQSYGGVEKIRYVREDRPGLGWAHNRGLMEVKGSIVAFTDDDVVADRYWLAELVKAFDAAENVGGVTGLAFVAELETPAQVWFDRFARWSSRVGKRVFDLAENRPDSPFYPYSCGMVGTGANMAFKTSVLREIGGFDPVLGPGTAALNGEDLAAYFEVLSRGYRIVHEPSAVVHHWHRREYAALHKQMYSYGAGLTAYLTKVLVERPWCIFDFVFRILSGLPFILSHQSPVLVGPSSAFPRELINLERKGLLYGPVGYLRSRWQTRGMLKNDKEPASSASRSD